MPYERDNIKRLAPYTPGEQPSFLETGGLAPSPAPGSHPPHADAEASPRAEASGTPASPRAILKLNTNENPYPPAPSVMRAIRELVPEALRLYPPADSVIFRRAAAQVLGVTPDHLIATNGGDELLRLLFTVFCDPTLFRPGGAGFSPPSTTRGSASGDELASGGTSGGGGGGIGMTNPSYTLYRVLAAIQDTPVTIVDRIPESDGGFALPADYATQLNNARCKLAFIVNPHAPTGRLEPLDTLRDLTANFRGVLVIDEAYVDFAPGNNAIQLINEGLDNIIILRSMSKGYSLAGLRFGFGIAHPSLIAALNKARDSYNVDILAQTAATAAIRDQAYAQGTWEKVRAERTRLAAALRRRGFTLPESHSNFILARVPRSLPGPKEAGPEVGFSGGATEGPDQARALYQGLKKQDILIRYFDTPPLADRLRITVGTPEQNDRLLQVLDTLL